MTLIPYGDQAILINFEQQIDSGVNEKVKALADALVSRAPNGFLYSIPAYASLTVIYDPEQTNLEELKNNISEASQDMNSSTGKTKAWTIPTCYGENYGPDLEYVANIKGLNLDRVIEIHSSKTYRVYMLGFLPGFIYLGRLDNSLITERKKTPRIKIKRGSVGLAGLQTGIYPSEAPGGWQIIGRTPLKTFLPEETDPFPIKHGDSVRFLPILQDEFLHINDSIEAGTFKFSSWYEQ